MKLAAIKININISIKIKKAGKPKPENNRVLCTENCRTKKP